MFNSEEWKEAPENCPKNYDEKNPACISCEKKQDCLLKVYMRLMGKIGKQMDSEESGSIGTLGVTPIADPCDIRYVDKFLDIYEAIFNRAQQRGIRWEVNDSINAMMYYLINFHTISYVTKIKKDVIPEKTLTFEQFSEMDEKSLNDWLRKELEDGRS